MKQIWHGFIYNCKNVLSAFSINTKSIDKVRYKVSEKLACLPDPCATPNWHADSEYHPIFDRARI